VQKDLRSKVRHTEMAARQRVETLATFKHELRGVQIIQRQSECGTKRNNDRLAL